MAADRVSDDPVDDAPHTGRYAVEADREIAELDRETGAGRRGAEPARHALAKLHDFAEVAPVDGEVHRDGVADQRARLKVLRVGDSDLGLRMQDVGDHLNRLRQPRDVRVVKHANDRGRRDCARKMQPRRAGDTLEHAAAFVESAGGDLGDRQLKIAN